MEESEERVKAPDGSVKKGEAPAKKGEAPMKGNAPVQKKRPPVRGHGHAHSEKMRQDSRLDHSGAEYRSRRRRLAPLTQAAPSTAQ